MDLEAVPFSLDTLMKTLATITAAGARDKDIEVLFHIAPATPLALIGDPLRLQQVLLNLAGNAIKFTSRGEVVLSVAPAEAVAPGCGHDRVRLTFSVRDTGVGIAPEHRRHIFDAFSQGDASTSRRFGGTGLGLAICTRLVALMGGRLTVVSEPGRGSTFSFTGCFGVDPQRAVAPAPPAGLPGSLRVLIVDDNPTAREILATMISPFGWQTDIAASGQEALEIIDRSIAAGQPFNLLLLDWSMPVVGGREVLRHLRSRLGAEAMPVVLVVTAFEQDHVRREADGAIESQLILTKPVTPSVLLDTVVTALSGTRRAHALTEPGLAERVPLAGTDLLLVDDNPINQMVARKILESAGAMVSVAASGRAALEILVRRRFDAVLMDVQMPGMDGYETTRLIREQLALTSLPVIAMTANALPADRTRCLAAGMNDHIAKPLDVEDAIRIILSHVGPPAGPAEPPDFDLEAAISRCKGDGLLLKLIIEEFVLQYADLPDSLSRQLAAGQLAAVSQKAHELKGVVANMGCGEAFVHAMAALQAAAERGDLALARIAGDEVCRRLRAMLTSCSRWLTAAPAQDS
ncbi:MAG: response regulator [Rhodospirillaceae bacterium]